jgi:hypothetical protein|uniref:Uncharacterized protein n=1 Tax=Desulfobacca acetoxidans TaxID=60893 RepID=A0A7C5EW14_9BACT
MSKTDLSVTGALVGALGGWVTEVVVQEITGQHFTHGVLELAGALAGLLRLDKRLCQALRDTVERAKDREDEDYRQVKQRIAELTEDLPELREILQNLMDAGIQARRA